MDDMPPAKRRKFDEVRIGLTLGEGPGWGRRRDESHGNQRGDPAVRLRTGWSEERTAGQSAAGQEGQGPAARHRAGGASSRPPPDSGGQGPAARHRTEGASSRPPQDKGGRAQPPGTGQRERPAARHKGSRAQPLATGQRKVQPSTPGQRGEPAVRLEKGGDERAHPNETPAFYPACLPSHSRTNAFRALR